MTARKPLVIAGGQVRQLAAGDTLDVAASLAHGTSWPAAPSVNDWFARDDLGVIGQWDGIRWLSAGEYTAGGRFVSGYPASIPIAAMYASYAPYITRCAISYQVYNNNNASNYWNIQLRSINETYTAASDITAVSTAYNSGWDDISTQNVTHIVPYYGKFDLNLSIIGSPGTLECLATIYYRFIIP